MKTGYSVLKRLKHSGKRYEIGAFIDGNNLDEQSAKRLLFLKVISKSYMENEDETVPDKTDDKLLKESGEGETVEEILDLNFNLDELKSGAKSLNLQFASNVKKPKLIQHIIENGHQEYFLDQLED